jgi:hypothetical protein
MACLNEKEALEGAVGSENASRQRKTRSGKGRV